MKTNNSQLINVAMVEDHSSVAVSMSSALDNSGIVRVTKIYRNLQSCRDGLAKEIPDILLLDIDLPDGDGVDFCAEITKTYPELKIIMLTAYKVFNIAKRALLNGALGFILKNSEFEELLAGIETVSMGEQFLCKDIDVLLKEKKKEKIILLNNIEKLVLKHIANGHTTKEIAVRLILAEDTIKTYRHNLLVKFGVKNVAELVKKAYEMRLI